MVYTTSSCLSLETLESAIAPLRAHLAIHPMYASVQTEADLRIFLESHVFAVWDFMSLLKTLQRLISCVDVPWIPSKFAAARRFVNEIVLGEESDEYQGQPMSHFEIYLEAMEAIKADTEPIRALIASVEEGGNWKATLDQAPMAAKKFVKSTFEVIEHGSLAAQAAAFTFGREDLIPDLFRGIVQHLNHQSKGNLNAFVWYLKRHIELDQDDHGPLALKMVSDLCGDSQQLWQEASDAAAAALKARIALWDGILGQIEASQN